MGIASDGADGMNLEECKVSVVGLPTPVGCPLCECAELTERHCKLVCEGCGYVESCEDNFASMFTIPNHHDVRNR